MREIKFRAWDGSVILDDVIPLAKRTIIAQNGYNTIDQVQYGWRIETDIWNYSDFEFMQYTGFKDKNGKEIYEGDIVHRFIIRPSYEVPEIEQVFEVFWDTSYAGFSVRSTSGWEPIFKVIVDSDCEVIGNIYENPELITNP